MSEASSRGEERDIGACPRWLLRSISVAIGAMAIAWSVLTLPVELTAMPLRPIADGILEGEKYSPEALARVAAYAKPLEALEDCYAGAPWGVAMFRLRQTAQTLAVAHEAQIIDQLRRADLAVRKALVCSPYQPFLWYALYWVDSTGARDTAAELSALEMSYRLGPYEGWISPLRSRAALPLLDHLDPDTRERVLTEFVNMATDDTQEAARAFVRADGPLRVRLLPLLARVPPAQRAAFARMLHRVDVDVQIPGVEDRDRLPWQQ